jgi:hypothetical protein
MCEQNQEKFDKECPPDFQSASYVAAHGQLDMILEDSSPQHLRQVIGEVSSLLISRNANIGLSELPVDLAPTEADMNAPFNYTRSRLITRPQVSSPSPSLSTSLTILRHKISSATSSNTSPSSTETARWGAINAFVEELPPFRSLLDPPPPHVW